MDEFAEIYISFLQSKLSSFVAVNESRNDSLRYCVLLPRRNLHLSGNQGAEPTHL